MHRLKPLGEWRQVIRIDDGGSGNIGVRSPVDSIGWKVASQVSGWRHLTPPTEEAAAPIRRGSARKGQPGDEANGRFFNQHSGSVEPKALPLLFAWLAARQPIS